MTTYWASSGKVNRSLPLFQRYGTGEYHCEYKFRLVSLYFFVYHWPKEVALPESFYPVNAKKKSSAIRCAMSAIMAKSLSRGEQVLKRRTECSGSNMDVAVICTFSMLRGQRSAKYRFHFWELLFESTYVQADSSSCPHCLPGSVIECVKRHGSPLYV